MAHHPPKPHRLRASALLGLPEHAPAKQRARAARLLRAHIRARLESSTEPAFRAAREAELEALEDALRETGGGLASTLRWPHPSPKVIWLALLGLAAVAGIRFGLADRATASHPDPPPSPATLSVLSDPVGATFWLLDPSDESVLTRDIADGRRAEWPSGDYRLRVEHSDCPEDWSQEIRLPPGGSKAYAPRLCQGQGQLIVRGQQTDDRVRIDGLDVGPTGENSHPLRTGRHRVSVEKTGFAPWQAEVAIRQGEPLTLLAKLEPEAPQTPPVAAPPAAPPAAFASPELASPDKLSGSPPPGGSPPGGPKARLEAGPGLGGSKTWHDAIKHELVTTYDRNGSRSLDSAEEIRSIPCPVWQNIETQYETGGLAVDLTHLYGFDGSEAPANTLGITYGQRGEAYQRMKECGLKTRL